VSSDPPQTSEVSSPRRRHLKSALLVLGITVGLVLVASAGMAIWLNSSLSNIEKIDVTVPEESRPARDDDDALNILLLGADAGTERNGPGTSIMKDATKEIWPQGKYRSDAIMLMHITADRDHAYVISVPRDTYLPVHDSAGQQRETTKINAALSIYGPSGALSTVENFADQRIDHLAMIDWDGFEDLTNALGGVEIDTADGGTTTLNGKEALTYARERHDLPGGDFDRVRRHQNFLRSLGEELIERETLTNPIALKKTLNSITKNLAVDDAWSNGSIRSLAFSMRGIDAEDITFLTIPTKGTDKDPVAGSIVVIDRAACEELFRAMNDDELDQWVEANDTTVLHEGDAVN